MGRAISRKEVVDNDECCGKSRSGWDFGVRVESCLIEQEGARKVKEGRCFRREELQGGEEKCVILDFNFYLFTITNQ